MTAVAAASAHAATTFAGFVQASSSPNISWTEAGTTGGSLSASDAPVVFVISSGPDAGTAVSAVLSLTGSTTSAASLSGSTLTQGGIDGSFSITTTSPVTIGGFSFSGNLLSGTFTGAEIVGPTNSSGAGTTSLQDSFTTGSDVTFTTDLLPFELQLGSSTSGNGFSFGATSVSLLSLNGSSPDSFSGTFGGNFATTVSTGGGGSGVPEPASWALMLLGVGAIGGVMRRSRSTGAALA